MKRLFILVFALSTIGGMSFAQGEYDAAKMSRNGLTGTARALGMGGAFGALGADATGVAINPAGLGVYTSSEISGTVNLSNTRSETELNAGKIETGKFKISCDNFSYVGVFALQDKEVPSINFGFAYNRVKNFDRTIKTSGQGLGFSMTDYMAYRAGNANPNDLDLEKNSAFENGSDWLGVLGYNTGLIGLSDDVNFFGKGKYGTILKQGETVNNSLYMKEKGSMSNYDFNVGTTISNILSVGLSLSVTDIDYRLYTDYHESFVDDNEMYLTNALTTEGSGFQAKLGVILKPINAIRIGVAYHTPKWYDMTDYYDASADAFGNYISASDDLDYLPRNEYEFTSPGKWVFSLAGVIGKRAIISADYEITNYGNMKFANRDGNPLDVNQFIKQDYKNAGTLRVGGEYRVTPLVSARVGYSWEQSPVKKEVRDGGIEIVTAGSIPHYILDGDAHYFTYGLGYKFSRSFYADIAFVMKSQKDDLYTNSAVFDKNGDVIAGTAPVKLTTNQFQGVLTFGYRF